jgi:hypothetical protein
MDAFFSLSLRERVRVRGLNEALGLLTPLLKPLPEGKGDPTTEVGYTVSVSGMASSMSMMGISSRMG